MELLKRKHLKIKVNINELNELKRGHLMNTRILTAKIYSFLPAKIKKEVNLADLQDAAMFHDYGKVLIPASILNKKGSLTNEEKQIMNLHSELGYELLKQQGIRESVLKLIKYHHQRPDNIGYPSIENDFEYNISLQILKIADEYTALTEKRSYKSALEKKNALEIIKQDVDNGFINKEIFDALSTVVRLQ